MSGKSLAAVGCTEWMDDCKRRIVETKAAVAAEQTAVYRARCELHRVLGNLADARRRLVETKREYRAAKSSIDQDQVRRDSAPQPEKTTK